MIRLLTPALLVLAATVTQAQTVWTVDGEGGSDFLEVQDAIDAAANGDLILVESGSYKPIRIDGKGVRIHARDTAGIFNEPIGGVDEEAILISNIAANQSVVIDGFSTFTFLFDTPSAVRVADCAGPVWIKDMFIDAYGGFSLHIERSASVVMENCVMQTNFTSPAPDGTPQPGPGALVEEGSRFYAYDCDFVGSHGPFFFGGSTEPTAPQDGGDGILILDSIVHLQGGQSGGGSGSLYFDGSCTIPGNGGNGVKLVSTGGPLQPTLRFTGTQFFGAFAVIGDPCAPPALNGAQIDPGPGSDVIDTFQATRLVEFSDGHLEPGDPLEITAHGEPGDLYFVYFALDPISALQIPTGVVLGEVDLHISFSPFEPIAIGALAGSSHTVVLTAPDMPVGVTAFRPVLQGFMLGAFDFPHSCAPLALTISE